MNRSDASLRQSFVLVAVLVALYMVSQFFRNSVNVIAPDLAREFALDANALSLIASIFYLSFAVVQIPVGMAIDRFGPKICLLAPALLLIAGTVMFSYAHSYGALVAARFVIGLGCSSFLMAPLAIYSDRFAPRQFAGIVGIQIGAGSFGALAATAPLAAASAWWGWRNAFLGVAVFTVVMIVLVTLLVHEGADSRQRRLQRSESLSQLMAGVVAATRVPSFWRVFLMSMAVYPSFGAIVGLWSGPWLAQVYGMSLEARGGVLSLMVGAQIMAMFAWGAADRWFSSYRVPCVAAALIGASILGLGALFEIPRALLTPYLIAMGLVFGFSPLLTAHGKSLFPPELIGRGLALLNIAAIGGVFFQQFLTGHIIALFKPALVDGALVYPPQAYRWMFGALAVEILLAVSIYLRAVDPHPGKH